MDVGRGSRITDGGAYAATCRGQEADAYRPRIAPMRIDRWRRTRPEDRGSSRERAALARCAFSTSRVSPPRSAVRKSRKDRHGRTSGGDAKLRRPAIRSRRSSTSRSSCCSARAGARPPGRGVELSPSELYIVSTTAPRSIAARRTRAMARAAKLSARARSGPVAQGAGVKSEDKPPVRRAHHVRDSYERVRRVGRIMTATGSLTGLRRGTHLGRQNGTSSSSSLSKAGTGLGCALRCGLPKSLEPVRLSP